MEKKSRHAPSWHSGGILAHEKEKTESKSEDFPNPAWDLTLQLGEITLLTYFQLGCRLPFEIVAMHTLECPWLQHFGTPASDSEST